MMEPRSVKVPLPDLGSEGLNDPDPGVRLRHIRLIEVRKDGSALPALVARLPLETDMRVLTALIATVGCLGDRALVEGPEPLLESRNDRFRANAVEAIARILPPEERRRLGKSL